MYNGHHYYKDLATKISILIISKERKGVGCRSLIYRAATGQGIYPRGSLPSRPSNRIIYEDQTNITHFVFDSFAIRAAIKWQNLNPDQTTLLLFYDITSESSFLHLLACDKIQALIDEVSSGTRAIRSIYVVGNKLDLEGDRKVSSQEGEAFADKLGAEFMEISVTNGDHFDELITRITDSYINKQQNDLHRQYQCDLQFWDNNKFEIEDILVPYINLCRTPKNRWCFSFFIVELTDEEEVFLDRLESLFDSVEMLSNFEYQFREILSEIRQEHRFFEEGFFLNNEISRVGTILTRAYNNLLDSGFFPTPEELKGNIMKCY